MLQTPVNDFNWQANNFADTVPGTVSATQLTANASPHTKGSDTAVFTGIANDCYGISIVISGGSTDATIRAQMVDILVDPAAGVGNAGSSWSVLINNLYSGNASLGSSTIGHSFYFPLYISAGTAIGARVQDVVGGATCRLSVRLHGKPTRPELCKVGSKVQTIGAVTASTSGVAVTPGNTILGSYSASLGTLTNPSWWWQLGVGASDSSLQVLLYRWDVAHDATSKYICMRGLISHTTTTTGEGHGKSAFGELPPIMVAPAGSDVYVRAYCNGVPDSTWTAVVYAVT